MMSKSATKRGTRFTGNQFDLALVDEVKHQSLRNVSPNSLASAVTFCELVATRLLGPRELTKRHGAFQNMLRDVIEAARAEREQHQATQRANERIERDQRAKQEAADRSRIIIPPGSSRN